SSDKAGSVGGTVVGMKRRSRLRSLKPGERCGRGERSRAAPGAAGCFGSARALAWLIGAAAAGLAAPAARAQERLSLPESVSIALRDNPQLEAARHQRNAAVAEANRGRATLQPDVEVSAGHIRRGPVLRFPNSEGNPNEVLPKSRSKLELTVQQPLYQFG